MPKSPFDHRIPTKAAKVPDRPEWIHDQARWYRWVLLNHSVPSFHFDREKPSLEAMGTKDGEIFLVNLNLMQTDASQLEAAQN